MMANEKPGGHGERCVAVGTLDMALWDASAKIAVPLYRHLADRLGAGSISSARMVLSLPSVPASSTPMSRE